MAAVAGIRGVHHIAVSVPDLAKARRFYIDLLGAEEEVEPLSWRDDPFIDSVIGLEGSICDQFICRLGNIQIEVFEYHTPRSDPQDPDRGVNHYGYTHFALQVDDIQACYDRLSAEGIRFHAPPDLGTITVDAEGNKTGYSATYCRDWFGNVFELIEIHPNEALKPI